MLIFSSKWTPPALSALIVYRKTKYSILPAGPFRFSSIKKNAMFLNIQFRSNKPGAIHVF